MRRFLRLLWRIITYPFRWIGRVNRDIHDFLTYDPEDTPLVDSFQKAVESPTDLLSHLNALRIHLFRAIGFMLVTTAFSFAFTAKIVDLLAEPIGGIHSLVAIDPTEPISVYMRVALLCGFALAFPYLAFELWLFAAPGLKPSSKRFGLAAIPIATIFFIGGMAFAYFVMMPPALRFLTDFMGLKTQLRPSSYISFVTSLLFWIGIVFEFPLVIFVLARLGLVKAKVLSDQWRLAVVIIAVVAAAITPTVDPISMSLVMGPMVALYFLSVFLARVAQRSREQAAAG